jgi:nitroimidazol reductase NimA-like FMN-containing flavoprotein (pyridoxamine 5'-phosphate oxidase superfamily)
MRTIPLLLLAVIAMICSPAAAQESAIDGFSGASYQMPPAVPQPEEQTRAEIQEWLSSHWLMSLATVNLDGSPHIGGVAYYADGLTIYFASRKDTNKIRNIERSPLVAYTVWDPVKNIDELKALQVSGKARIVSGEERERIAAHLTHLPDALADLDVVAVEPRIARWTNRGQPASPSLVIQLGP